MNSFVWCVSFLYISRHNSRNEGDFFFFGKVKINGISILMLKPYLNIFTRLLTVNTKVVLSAGSVVFK